MKNYTLWFLGILGLGLVALVIERKLPSQSGEVTSKPDQVVFSVNTKPLSCGFERKTVVAINESAKPVTNGEGLKAYDMTFLENESAYFIVTHEEPFKVGQTFLVATNCEELSTTSATYQQAQGQTCSGIYLYNKQLWQMRRECGIIVNERAVFLQSPTKTF